MSGLIVRACRHTADMKFDDKRILKLFHTPLPISERDSRPSRRHAQESSTPYLHAVNVRDLSNGVLSRVFFTSQSRCFRITAGFATPGIVELWESPTRGEGLPK